MKYEIETHCTQCPEKKWHVAVKATFETGDELIGIISDHFDTKEEADREGRKAMDAQVMSLLNIDGSHLKSEPLYSRETDLGLH